MKGLKTVSRSLHVISWTEGESPNTYDDGSCFAPLVCHLVNLMSDAKKSGIPGEMMQLVSVQ